MILPQPMERFLTEVKREFGAEGAQALREAFESTELAADDCPEHQKFMTALGWVCAQPKPLHERLDAIFQIVEMPRGYVTVTIPRPA
jgi:hypothetical protein